MAAITENDLRARQAEIKAEIAAIEASTVPMRQARDAFIAKHQEERAVMDAALREAEAPLLALRSEAAMLARALGGKRLSVRTA